METGQIEYIIDHYRNPRNYGSLREPDISHEEGNPLCGDVIRFDISIKNNKVDETRFTGKGCAISQAAASILSEIIIYRDLDDIKVITPNEIIDALGGSISPVRYKCALLPLKVVKSGLFGMENWPGEE